MSVVYAGLDAPEFARDMAVAIAAVDTTIALFDQHGIAKREASPPDDATVAAFEAAVAAFNPLFERITLLQSYIHSFVSTDSRNALAQARTSEFQQVAVKLAQLTTRFTAWVGGLDVEDLLERSATAREYEYMLRQAQRRAQHLMSPDEEALAAELNPTGAGAWSRLYGNLSSQLMVAIEQGGQPSELPVSAVRNLAYDADREVRRTAYEAELAAWRRSAVPIAAALNSVKGEVITLARRRGWQSPLDLSLFSNSIDREALEAMLAAARESFPDFRRYLRAKARMLGVPQLAFYDLFAPVGASGHAWGYDEAADFIVEQFGSYSERMRDFAARAFRERWIDAEPRPGKRDGAFCMRLRADESRILSNYEPSFKSVSTLAHELGHAYHNTHLARQPELNRSTPMTLAETASIFCETIVRKAAMASASPAEQVEILEGALMNSGQVVVDITSRFLFEQAVFEGRAARELSVDELCALMRDAQLDTYGDGLDPAALHPFMWAAKPHYYSAGNSFYNYPYMFGLLFGLGLYARYQSDPAGFKAGYDDLLASTGLADAATLARRMEVDIRSIDFWRASLGTIRADVDRFEALAGA
jgi:pepF/M3 family oligoendopeptidase